MFSDWLINFWSVRMDSSDNFYLGSSFANFSLVSVLSLLLEGFLLTAEICVSWLWVFFGKVVYLALN